MWGNTPRLADYLEQRLQAALKELDSLPADYLLSENEDILVTTLLQKHMPKPIQIDWAGVQRSEVSETKTTVRDRFDYSESYEVPASRLTLHFPFTGAKVLLEYQASTFTIAGASDGKVVNSSITLEIVERTLTSEVIQRRIEKLKSDMGQRAEWANNDLKAFVPAAEQRIRTAYGQRKQRILADRAVEDALGIPIISKGAPRQPVPAQRKQVSLEQRQVRSRPLYT